jgi:hypothetical protein
VWRWVALLPVVAGCNQLLGIHELGAAARDSNGDAADAILVQQGNTGNEQVASVSLALPSAPASGDVLVLVGGSSAGLLQTSGGSPDWTLAAESREHTGIEILLGVADGDVEPIQISAPASGAIWMSVTEWSGLDAGASLLDVANATGGIDDGDGAAVSVTPTAADVVVFGESIGGPADFGTPGATWTPLDPASADGVVVQGEWYEIATAGAPVAPELPVSGSGWDVAIVALRRAP